MSVAAAKALKNSFLKRGARPDSKVYSAPIKVHAKGQPEAYPKVCIPIISFKSVHATLKNFHIY